MIVFLWIGYLIIGFAQFFAIWDYFGGAFLGFIAAFILSGMPVVGTIFGVLGAHDVWGWTYTQAILLYALPMLILLTYALFLHKDDEGFIG